MQSSGQQPKEKIERENAEVEDIKGQASSPLYEFPADQQGMVCWVGAQRLELFPAQVSVRPPPNRACTFQCTRLSSHS